MRLIDADFTVYAAESEFDEEDASKIRWLISHIPTIDAETVRHTENTTVIDTDDVREWKSRVMVCERNSHWGRLYYESDTKHGKWVFGGDGCVLCSVCDEEVPNYIHRNYCPHCGAKMDLED